MDLRDTEQTGNGAPSGGESESTRSGGVWETLAGQDLDAGHDPTRTLARSHASAPGEEALQTMGPPPVASDQPAPVETGSLPWLLFQRPDNKEAVDLEIVGLLEEGLTTKVELARQRSLRREVAVKSARDEVHQGAVEALLQEALFMGSLEHPNIVPVHQLGVGPQGRPALVMKRVEGTSWADILTRPDHPHWARTSGSRLRVHIEILMQVCNAVAFAHARRVVHRDIKPSNVMLGSFGEVYLVDWGLAMHLDAPRRGSGLVGTPSYMAPEMLDGDARITEQTDVFLLGSCLYRALAGAPRHQGDTLEEVLEAVTGSSPKCYPDDAPRELVALCEEACAPKPTMRLESAAVFRLRLQAFLQHQSSRELSTEARSMLDALAQGPFRDALDTAEFAEVRFAFQQALREWPDNQDARDGLQACLELGIRRAIQSERRGLAASLLAQLPSASPELETELKRLDTRLRQRTDAGESLRQLKTEHDPAVARRQRAAMAWFACFCTSIGAVIATLNERLWDNPYDYRSAFFASGLLLLGLALIPLYWGRLLLKTTLNRRFVGMCMVIGSICLFNRVLSFGFGVSLESSLTLDMLLFSATCAMGALLIDVRLMSLPVPLVLFLTPSLFIPEVSALDVQALAFFFASAAFGWFWWKDGQDLSSTDPRPEAKPSHPR